MTQLLGAAPEFTPLVAYRGEGFTAHWVLKDAAGEPITDFTGWSATAVLRFDVLLDEVLHTWSTDTGGAEFADNGVRISSDTDDTAAWSFGGGVFDLRVTNQQDQREYPVVGSLAVRATSSRAS